MSRVSSAERNQDFRLKAKWSMSAFGRFCCESRCWSRGTVIPLLSCDSLWRRAMMGRLNHDQEQLLYSFHLDEAVPHDHPVRKIAAVLDLSWVHSDLAPFYPKMGRPSIDPELLIRMLIIGYVFAIRTERAICRDVQVNLAYRWFCRLSIEDKIPDHSAFSRARHERFRDSDIFRRVFERVIEACIAAGLVGGEGFAVDASLIVADANKQRSIPGSEWNTARDRHGASRAIREYLATLDDAAFGAASEVMPKFVSPSDPAAQWTGAMRGPQRADGENRSEKSRQQPRCYNRRLLQQYRH